MSSTLLNKLRDRVIERKIIDPSYGTTKDCTLMTV